MKQLVENPCPALFVPSRWENRPETMKRGPLTVAALIWLLLLGWTIAAFAMDGDERVQALRSDFEPFLATYVRAVKQKDTAFLARIHPELPPEMVDFFFDLTQGMMRHAEQHDLQPEIACRAYGVCTVTWPQPQGHWAAQSFIRHAGEWRWLAE